MRSSSHLVKMVLFRIQYTSNLHVLKNANLQRMIKPVAPYLALVGNCGTKETLPYLFEYASKKFEHVFFVPGPEDPSYQWLYSTITPFKNVHFLQRSSYYLPQENISIVGTTWWKHTVPWAREGYPISLNQRTSYDTHWIKSHINLNLYQHRDTVLLTHYNQTFPRIYDPSVKLHIYGDNTQSSLEYVDQTIRVVNPNISSTACAGVIIPTIEKDESVQNSLLYKAIDEPHNDTDKNNQKK